MTLEACRVFILAGGRGTRLQALFPDQPKPMVPVAGRPFLEHQISLLAQQGFDLPEWLFEESYQAVGDLAETVALLLPPAHAPQERGLADWLLHHLLPLLPTPTVTRPVGRLLRLPGPRRSALRSVVQLGSLQQQQQGW